MESEGMKAASETMTSQKAWRLMRNEYLPKQTWLFVQSRKQWDNELDEFNAKSQGRVDEQYLLDLADLKINQTEELAKSLFIAGCEIWKTQGREESQGFFQAIWENSLLPLFRSRRQHVIHSIEGKTVLGLTDETISAAVARVGGWLAGQMTSFRLRIEAGDSHFPEQPEVVQEHLVSLPQKPERKPGPTPMWRQEAAEFARKIWRREQNKSKTHRISNDGLMAIARELDAKGPGPPKDYLYGKAGNPLSDYNTKHGNAGVRPIDSWVDLVQRGDKAFIRKMRRVLSDLANKRPK